MARLTRSLLLISTLATLIAPAGSAPVAEELSAQERMMPVSVRAPKAQCYWEREGFLPTSAPDDVPTIAMRELERWWPFAKEHGYRVDIEREGRVLILSDYRERLTRKAMIRAEEVIEFFDLELPDNLLDLEETMSTRRLAMPVPKATPYVLVRLSDREDYEALVDYLVDYDPRLEAWGEANRDAHDFRLVEPCVAAWIVEEDGREEWREENELVNQFTHCLLEGRFGRQPHWLAEGLAYYVELELLDSIHCFPGRYSFVGATEHSGWENYLRLAFRNRKDEPLRMDELTAWRRGTWDEHSAALSWGLVTYLLDHCLDEEELKDEEEDEILGDISREMGAHRQTFGVQTRPDGSWASLPNYELPTMIQRQIVEHHGGQNVWEEATLFFWQGSLYKPSRTR